MGLQLENFRSPLALFRFYGICAMGLMLDLATKYVAESELKFGAGYRFVDGWLHFEWVENTGAVFGIGEGKRWLFVFVSVLALGFLTWLFSASKRQWGYQMILGMLLAGVLGNLYDRVMLGHVRDMIHALPGWRWPENFPGRFGGQEVFPYVFNVADVLLCCGVGLMLIHAFVQDLWLKPKVPLQAAETPAT